ncbi:MAG: hypothetical protein CVU85_03210 [Firmicutes bacterium HGW-Firmicutes-10]|nr:MAG: hypothetical protein CVU85_03210 [Firmicutes bacterium HGW-Firmicutes-10]
MKKLFMLLFVSLFLLFNSALAVNAADRFTNHNVEMVVQEDGLYKLTHVIDVYFDTPSQGIYALIPQVYKMNFTLEDGTIVNRTYRFPVSDINVVNEDFLVESSYEGVRIRIGTEGKYFTGTKRFTYSYTIKTRDLGLSGRQLFYFNIIGDGWELPVDRVEFKILFPKNITSFTKEFYSGAYGSSANNNVEYTVEGNMIFGTVATGLRQREALTIWMPVSNDFFSFPKPFNYTILSTMYAMLFTVIVGLLYIRFGKDDLLVKTVEFNPPTGYSSAQVGYIFDGAVDNKDVVSLIIEWAANGYLTIEELENKNIQLNKVADIDPKAISAEKSLFNDLFRGRDSVTTKELEKSFYTSINFAKMNITRYFLGNKERRIFSMIADALQILLGILVITIPAFHLSAVIYNQVFYLAEAIGIGFISSLLAIPPVIIFTMLMRKKQTMKKASISALTIVGIVLTALFIFIQFTVHSAYNGNILMFIAVITGYLISLYFITIMDKRTDKGLDLYGKVLGLKNFIELAEKDKLEMLVHDDPEYFYKILPYAYVLNVTDTWAKKFESITIQPPQWYVGSGPFNHIFFVRSLNSSMHRMTSAMTSLPPAKAGRGGGGFGSGGGGFSGGGFGGGGGGRW